MINALTYLLQGFGYKGLEDFRTTVFKLLTLDSKLWVLLCSIGATIQLAVHRYTGLDTIVFAAFVALIIAEYVSGIKASYIKGERFKSRKFGRMILKIGIYVLILSILHVFAQHVRVPVFRGIEINPFVWLYYFVLVAIVFQLLISWLENLGAMGYKETRTIAGMILRKFNSWFEFDGTKDNGKE